MAVIHEIKFQRNTVTGKWRARCSCGWFAFGTQDEVKNAAAVHDIEEWVDVPEAEKPYAS